MAKKETSIETLPLWAQDKIRLLELRLKESREQVNALTESPPSPLKYRFGPDEYRNLPVQDRVRVEFPNGARIDLCLSESKYPNQLYVMADYGVSVQGESHNTLYLIPERPR